MNANYNSSMVSFVGYISESLDIWQYMKDEIENDFSDFFKDLVN